MVFDNQRRAYEDKKVNRNLFVGKTCRHDVISKWYHTSWYDYV